jgi:hypothetical protein
MQPFAFQALVYETLASRQQCGTGGLSIKISSLADLREGRRPLPQFGQPLRREVDFAAVLGSQIAITKRFSG